MVRIFNHLLLTLLRRRLKISIVVALLLVTSPAFSYVGEVSFQSRPAKITRSTGSVITEVGTKVQKLDKIETLAGEVKIQFIDNTKVSISEYSTMVIDEFVYNSNTKKGKLNLKARLGKLRYTSGLIAKNSREDVKITTPTASVSVRGTDFEVVVTETGQSTFTLLPSIGANGLAFTGSIDVITSAGAVTLNTAFEVTEVKTVISAPTVPVVNKQRQQADGKEDDAEKDDDTKNGQGIGSEQTNIKEDEDGGLSNAIIIKKEEGEASVFVTKEGKAIFTNEGKENYVKLILQESANATLNYENKGAVTGGQLNNGGSIIINIIQQ